jgi:hypothetical protein
MKYLENRVDWYVTDKITEMNGSYTFYASQCKACNPERCRQCLERLHDIFLEATESIRFLCLYLNKITEAEMNEIHDHIYEEYEELRRQAIRDLS